MDEETVNQDVDQDIDQDVDRNIEELLLVISRNMRKLYTGLGEEFGLNSMQMSALHALAEGNAAMRNLAEKIGCDTSYITGIADALESKNLVTRQADTNDRRVKQLVLTQQGHTLRQDFFDKLYAKSPTTSLNATEKKKLHALLQKMRGASGEDVYS
ncbi:MAG: MarR family transcriptional regulator [Deinococcota bacterium]